MHQNLKMNFRLTGRYGHFSYQYIIEGEKLQI